MVGGTEDILRGPKDIPESPDRIEQLLDPPAPRAQDYSLLHDVRPEFSQVNVAVSVWIHPLII